MEAWHQPLRSTKMLLVITSRSNVFPDLPKNTPYALKPLQPLNGRPSLLRHPIAAHTSTGILTCFPSTTLFSLALGTDSPCSDYRRTGNLGLPACRVFTYIIVTHVSIRTSDTSSKLPSSPSTAYRTLRYQSKLLTSIPQLRCMV